MMNVLSLWIVVIAVVKSIVGQTDFCTAPPGEGSCDCTTTANTVVCTGTSFTSFPSAGDFTSVNGGTITTLTLNGNTGLPSTFDGTTFAGKGWDTNLQQLRINSIGLQTIDPNGLTGLTALRLLDISSNNALTTISTNALTPVTSLQTIALGSSQLTCCNWPGAAAGTAGIIVTGTCIDSTGNAVSADPSSFNYASCITTTSPSTSVSSGGFFSRLFGNGNFWWIIPAGALLLSDGFTGGFGNGLLAGSGGGLLGGGGLGGNGFGGLGGGSLGGSGFGGLGGGGLGGSGFGGLGGGSLGGSGFSGLGDGGLGGSGFGGLGGGSLDGSGFSGLGGSGFGGGFGANGLSSSGLGGSGGVRGGFGSFGSGGDIGTIGDGEGLISPGGSVNPFGSGELGFSSRSGTIVRGPYGATFIDGGISETGESTFIDGGIHDGSFIDINIDNAGFSGGTLGNSGVRRNYNGQRLY